jgi:hypothetical protein
VVPTVSGVRVGARLRFIAVLAASAVLAACGPAASFSPTADCVADGRAPGAYPELEALLPRTLGDRPPTSVDSGRSCSDRALGTLLGEGVRELRFAGATWDEGDGAATSIAVLATAPNTASLEPAWVEDFYEAGARASSKTSNTTISRPSMGAAGTVWRLDTLNDLSQQTVVVRALGDVVQVVLVATRVDPDASLAEHNRRVDTAVEAASVIGPTNAGG